MEEKSQLAEKEALLQHEEKAEELILPPPATEGANSNRTSLRKRAAITLAAVGLFCWGWNLYYSAVPPAIEPSGVHLLADPDARGKLSVKEAEEQFLSIPSGESAKATSRKYATLPHVAGTPQDFETAKYFLESLQDALNITSDSLPVYDAGTKESQEATRGIVDRSIPTAWIDTYYTALNYPLERSLSILDSETKDILWNANVEEDPASNSTTPDPAGEHVNEVGTWHGLSRGGDVTGRLVYANYGQKADFDHLRELGVNLTGTIAIVRYGGSFRGLKVKASQEAGCVGTLIYSDIRDDGTVTPEQGYLTYPDGPARNHFSVQRGSAQFLSMYPGDPSTEGYPSYKDAKRSEQRNKPSIPSLPISWANAKRLLSEIWGDKQDEWFKLDGKTSENAVRLVNGVNETVVPIWNVYGVIPGHIKDEIVVLGNHRDAWVLGAADPSSGTVSATEVIKGLGQLLKSGWRPLRTVLIASWDAEEYGLFGSTEFGEDFSDFIGKNVVAYLNTDVSSAGSRLRLGGSPSLAWLFRSVAEELPHPSDEGRTLWDATKDKGKLTGNDSSVAQALGLEFSEMERVTREMAADPLSTGIGALGSGSDYTVFLQRIGIASGDSGFTSTHSDPVYHYHSIWDSHTWQLRYNDPDFSKHVSVAKYLGLVTLRLADSIILPLNTTQYSLELSSYLRKVEALAAERDLSGRLEADFARLRRSIRKLAHASTRLDKAKHKAERKLRKALRDIDNSKSLPKSSRHETRSTSANGRPIDVEQVRVGMAGADAWSRKQGSPKRAVRDDRKVAERNAIDRVRIGKAGSQASGLRMSRRRVSRTQMATPGLPLQRSARCKSGIFGRVLRFISNQFRHLRCYGERLLGLRASCIPRKYRKLVRAARAVHEINSKLSGYEGQFIDEKGIKDREWYRHLGVAPGKWLGYGATTFPGLTEAIDEKDADLAHREIERLQNRITALIKHIGRH